MINLIFLIVLTQELVLAAPKAAPLSGNVCSQMDTSWMKCTGKLPKGTNKQKITIKSSGNKQEDCYGWWGQAEYTCLEGKWILNKKSQSCSWDCFCCY